METERNRGAQGTHKVCVCVCVTEKENMQEFMKTHCINNGGVRVSVSASVRGTEWTIFFKEVFNVHIYKWKSDVMIGLEQYDIPAAASWYGI